MYKCIYIYECNKLLLIISKNFEYKSRLQLCGGKHREHIMYIIILLMCIQELYFKIKK